MKIKFWLLFISLYGCFTSCTPFIYMSNITHAISQTMYVPYAKYYDMYDVNEYIASDTLLMYELKSIVQQEILYSSLLEYSKMSVEKYGHSISNRKNYRYGDVAQDNNYYLLNFFLRDGYELPVTITPICLKYEIPYTDMTWGGIDWDKNCRFEYFKITIPYVIDSVNSVPKKVKYTVKYDDDDDLDLTFYFPRYVSHHFFYCKRMRPSAMFKLDSTAIQMYKRRLCGKYKHFGRRTEIVRQWGGEKNSLIPSEYQRKQVVKEKEYIVACRRRGVCDEGALNYDYETNPFEIYFLSKDFAHNEVAQRNIYFHFVAEYLLNDSLKGIYKIPKPKDVEGCVLGYKMPIKVDPSFLSSYIYIMSYGDYEPEDVFFEKKHFKQFYYTFRSLRDGKNYRLHYNARNGKFVKYKEIKR